MLAASDICTKANRAPERHQVEQNGVLSGVISQLESAWSCRKHCWSSTHQGRNGTALERQKLVDRCNVNVQLRLDT